MSNSATVGLFNRCQCGHSAHSHRFKRRDEGYNPNGINLYPFGFAECRYCPCKEHRPMTYPPIPKRKTISTDSGPVVSTFPKGRLILGDCLEIVPTLPRGSVDMVFADLPYGMTQNKWDSPIDLVKFWKACRYICKQSTAFIFTGSQPFTAFLIASNPDWFHCEWVWWKNSGTGFLNCKKHPLKDHENIIVFCRDVPTYNPIKTKGELRIQPAKGNNGGNYGKDGTGYTPSKKETDEWFPRSVLRLDKVSATGENRLHTTQKPVSLAEYFIRTYSNPGATILDPTAGSGTTAIAAINTGRQFVCIESDPEIYETARNRIHKHKEPTKWQLLRNA